VGQNVRHASDVAQFLLREATFVPPNSGYGAHVTLPAFGCGTSLCQIWWPSSKQRQGRHIQAKVNQ
jgi:hypothetical protein